MKKVIHYINQFFAGEGGEDTAHMGPKLVEGVVGPGRAFQGNLEGGEITHTIICGDNYLGEKKEEAVEEIMDLIKDLDFDLFKIGRASCRERV